MALPVVGPYGGPKTIGGKQKLIGRKLRPDTGSAPPATTLPVDGGIVIGAPKPSRIGSTLPGAKPSRVGGTIPGAGAPKPPVAAKAKAKAKGRANAATRGVGRKVGFQSRIAKEYKPPVEQKKKPAPKPEPKRRTRGATHEGRTAL